MRDKSNSDGTTPVFGIIAVVLLIAIGGGFFAWQRQQDLAAARQSWAYSEAEVSALESQDKSSNSRIDNPSPKAAIRQVLLTQQQAWNDGDIDTFMQSYWKSDELTFSSGGKVTRGWQATLDSYRERYSTRQEMGQLDFSDLEVTALGDDAALVLGHWHLTRDADDLGGKFTLVFRRILGEWLIIHDHTSKSESPR